MVKNLPGMQETWVQSLGQEGPLEKAVATHSPVSLPGKTHGLRTWWAPDHGVAKSWTHLKRLTVWLHFHSIIIMPKNKQWFLSVSNESQG